MINLGGGIQEILAIYINKNTKFKLSIMCTGAAIAFLTGEQAPINKYVDSTQSKIEIVKTTNAFNLKKDSDLIANLAIVNNIRRINKFHEIVNKSLNQEGIYLSCSETLEERRTRVRAKTPFGFKNIVRTLSLIHI